jgi:hypothetical protein
MHTRRTNEGVTVKTQPAEAATQAKHLVYVSSEELSLITGANNFV